MPNLDSHREPTVLILQLAKTAIREAGGEFVGVQRGVPRAGNPDLVLFNDPMTGTTLALAVDDKHITVQRVQAKIERSRHRFAAMRDRSGNFRQSATRNDRRSRQVPLNEPPRLSHQSSGSGERRTTGAPPTIVPIASLEDLIPMYFRQLKTADEKCEFLQFHPFATTFTQNTNQSHDALPNRHTVELLNRARSSK